MTDLSRRSLFTGLGALIAAPAIVRAASIMPVRAIAPVRPYLTLNEIAREIVQRWENSRAFLAPIDPQWTEDSKWGFSAQIAAPAIVRAASIMPVRAPFRRKAWVTLNEITRECALDQMTREWDFQITREWVIDFRITQEGMMASQWTERFSAQPEWVETVYPIVHAVYEFR